MAALRDKLSASPLRRETQQSPVDYGGETRASKFFKRNESDSTQTKGADDPPRDFDTAYELLERATRAFDVLVDRCQYLETELAEAAGRAKVQAAEQDQWKKLAEGMKAHAQKAEQQQSEMRARAEAAEARAASAEARTAELEKAAELAAERAAAAQALSTKLHDKVTTAFGIGSRAHVMLEAVVTSPPSGQGVAA